MNRRGFIQISSVALLPVLMGIFPRRTQDKKEYTIKVHSNRVFGHTVRETMNIKPHKILKTDYIIVGGGIAGLSAATVLKNEDFMLFEASDRLGGTSACDSWKSSDFAMGAHYELAYPETYGKQVIDLLTKMDIIFFNPVTKLYEFRDEQYVIKPKDETQCFINQKCMMMYWTVHQGLDIFYDILEEFSGNMPLPTHLISKKYHYLNDINFKNFLQSKMTLSVELEHRINYQMLDDWGAKSDQVSALAGIHYYTCRPYNQQDVQLFSPPIGNAYFGEKLIGEASRYDALHTNSIVRKINLTDNGVEAEVLSNENKVILIKAKGLIYAGQKHALKYILETEKPLFSNDYAPWVVINFVCKKNSGNTKWQNDVLTDDLNFLGYVNSSQQHQRSTDHDVLTAYYCFSSEDRQVLVDIETQPEEFVEACITVIEQETNSTFGKDIEHVNINVMGHAMPIPKPGYLSFEQTTQYNDRLYFAGVDSGRLPLFYEACDSGIEAAKALLKSTNTPST